MYRKCDVAFIFRLVEKCAAHVGFTLMKITSLVLAAVTFILTSCLEIKSVINVSKDGSATIEESALISAQLKGMMAQGGGAGGADSLKDIVPDKAKAEERAKQLGEGVTVQSHEEVTSPDGKSGVKVTYAVADIRKITYSPFGAKSKDGVNEKPATFTLDGPTLTMTLPVDTKSDKPKSDKPKPPKEQMLAQMAMMKPMFAGMRLSAEIKSPGGIASSDATHYADGTVTVLDMQIDKLMDKPESFIGFMESAQDNLSMSEASQKFQDVEGIKIEGKGTVKIELK